MFDALRKRLEVWLWPRSATHAALLAALVTLSVGLAAGVTGLGNDSFTDGYMELATSLLHGDGFRFGAGEPLVLHRPPIYPLVLLPVAALPSAAQPYGLIVLHSLTMGLSAAAMFILGRELFGESVAAWAVWVLLSDLWLLVTVRTTPVVYLEMSLFIPVCCLVTRWLASPASARPWRIALGLGAFGGLLCLTHGAMLVTMGLVFLALAVRGIVLRDISHTAAAGVALAVMLAVIAPWTVRNGLVTGRLIPISANSGYAYFAGNAHWGIGAPMQVQGERWQAAALRHSGVQGDPDQLTKFWGLRDWKTGLEVDQRMAQHLRRHFAQVAQKMGLNAAEFYLPIVHPIYTKLSGDEPQAWSKVLWSSKNSDWLLVSAYHAALWAMAGWGWSAPAQHPRTSRGRWWVLAFIAMFAFPYLPFLVRGGFAGYAWPTIPLLALLAARVSCRPVRGSQSKC